MWASERVQPPRVAGTLLHSTRKTLASGRNVQIIPGRMKKCLQIKCVWVAEREHESSYEITHNKTNNTTGVHDNFAFWYRLISFQFDSIAFFSLVHNSFLVLFSWKLEEERVSEKQSVQVIMIVRERENERWREEKKSKAINDERSNNNAQLPSSEPVSSTQVPFLLNTDYIYSAFKYSV